MAVRSDELRVPRPRPAARPGRAWPARGGRGARLAFTCRTSRARRARTRPQVAGTASARSGCAITGRRPALFGVLGQAHERLGRAGERNLHQHRARALEPVAARVLLEERWVRRRDRSRAAARVPPAAPAYEGSPDSTLALTRQRQMRPDMRRGEEDAGAVARGIATEDLPTSTEAAPSSPEERHGCCTSTKRGCSIQPA